MIHSLQQCGGVDVTAAKGMFWKHQLYTRKQVSNSLLSMLIMPPLLTPPAHTGAIHSHSLPLIVQ
jgi:hypothetical protein